MKTLLTLALLAGLAPTASALDNRIDTMRPDAPALAPYGVSRIGVRTLQLVNPGQVDVLKTRAGQPNATYDRPLTVEVWYPATLPAGTLANSTYRTTARDGKTLVTLSGSAVRDAAPASGGPYPLVIISHGYPGNRLLLAHLGENLASKGYVVASIDHTDSTYTDQGAFGSTLLNRPLDQLFVLNEMGRRNAAEGFLKGLVDANNTALIGYSMGGYGVLNALGVGFAPSAAALPFAPPNTLLATRAGGSPDVKGDPRVKAAIAIAPWGNNAGLWNAEGLRGLRTPTLFIAGSVDDVSGYAPGVRTLYEGAVNAERYLLTFENANHNAGAPIPAPIEAWSTPDASGNTQFNHYADPVWDNTRMNNVTQHFATAFLGRYLKNDAAMTPFLTLVPNSKDGKWSVEQNGALKADHTYWRGFANRTAVGLRFERLAPQP